MLSANRDRVTSEGAFFQNLVFEIFRTKHQNILYIGVVLTKLKAHSKRQRELLLPSILCNVAHYNKCIYVELQKTVRFMLHTHV